MASDFKSMIQLPKFLIVILLVINGLIVAAPQLIFPLMIKIGPVTANQLLGLASFAFALRIFITRSKPV